MIIIDQPNRQILYQLIAVCNVITTGIVNKTIFQLLRKINVEEGNTFHEKINKINRKLTFMNVGS